MHAPMPAVRRGVGVALVVTVLAAAVAFAIAAAPSASAQVVPPHIISLISIGNRQYVTAEAAGAQPLMANRPRPGHWERFQLVVPSNAQPDQVALKSWVNGMYVSAGAGGNEPLIANRNTIGPSETFTFVGEGSRRAGQISLRSIVNGLFVSAASGTLIANQVAVASSWERFQLNTHSMIALDAWGVSGAGLVAAENWGTNPLVANRSAIGVWEQFDLIEGDGFVALRAAVNGFYVAVRTDFRLVASVDRVIAPEARFGLFRNSDGSYSLLSQLTGRFVSVTDSIRELRALADNTIGNAEKFTRYTTSA